MGIARYEKRLGSYAVDFVLSLLFGIAIMVPMFIYDVLGESTFLVILVGALFSYGWFIILTTLVSWLSGGSSIGDFIFGIRTIHADGERYTFGDAFLRGAAKGILPLMAVNAVYMLATHTERSVFDRLSHTLVVDRRRR